MFSPWETLTPLLVNHWNHWIIQKALKRANMTIEELERAYRDGTVLVYAPQWESPNLVRCSRPPWVVEDNVGVEVCEVSLLADSRFTRIALPQCLRLPTPEELLTL